MGTRADFYVGRGETAEWVGSVAWDGYPNEPWGIGRTTDLFTATTEADFRRHGYLEGDEIVLEARKPVSAIARELAAFVQAMDATGAWEPVPLLFANNPPWGPADWGFIDRCLAKIEAMLAAAGAVDGVYIANHGAMTSTETLDPDGEIVARVRAAVGPETAVIVTHDVDTLTRITDKSTLPAVDYGHARLS